MPGYNWVHTTRLAVLSVVSLFSLIVLGLAGHNISSTQSHTHTYYNYAGLAVATAVLSFTVPAMLIIDALRRGAFTSLIVVELCWLGFLWIMWLATGAYSADTFGTFPVSCTAKGLANWISNGCQETQAIIAFSFLNWIALTGYLVILLAFSIIAANNGAPIWMRSVKEAEFGSVPKLNMSGAMGTPEGKTGHAVEEQPVMNQSYPPQQPYPAV